MSTQPKERPILFSGPMVRAILDGRKTQTRRIMRPQPDRIVGGIPAVSDFGDLLAVKCPYGRPGDRLWVRETWAKIGCIGEDIDWFEPAYRADFENGVWSGYGDMCFERWRPSIHMPRAASRILLEISSIRVERLQDISEEDAIAEGIEKYGDCFINYLPEGQGLKGVTNWIYNNGRRYVESPIHSFCTLWQSINGPESWDENPWVWVVEFKRIQP